MRAALPTPPTAAPIAAPLPAFPATAPITAPPAAPRAAPRTALGQGGGGGGGGGIGCAAAGGGCGGGACAYSVAASAGPTRSKDAAKARRARRGMLRLLLVWRRRRHRPPRIVIPTPTGERKLDAATRLQGPRMVPLSKCLSGKEIVPFRRRINAPRRREGAARRTSALEGHCGGLAHRRQGTRSIAVASALTPPRRRDRGTR